MIIFLLVALSIYSLINFYIIRRGWQALSGKETLRNIFLAVFLFLALSYPAARFAERLHRGSLSEVLVFIGAFYLALMVYLLLLVFLVDIVRLGNKIFHFFPSAVTEHAQKAGQIAFLVVGVAALMIVIGGIINALHLRLRTLDLSIDKSAGEVRSLNISLVSDIHLGTIVRSSRLEKIVERTNELKPDLVLMQAILLMRIYLCLKRRKWPQSCGNSRPDLACFLSPGIMSTMEVLKEI